MTRCLIGLVVILILAVLVAPSAVEAQSAGKVPRIAILDLNFPPSASAPTSFFDTEAFRHELREHGWVEGHTIAIEWRWAEGSLERFASLVAEVIRLPVEVLVVPNATTAEMAHEATSTIPIVVVGGGNLATHPLIRSLAHPGGNVTGIATLGPEVNAKRLELLKEAVPTVTRVAVLRGLLPQTQELQALEVTARSLAVELHLLVVRDASEFDSAFAAMTRAQAQALFVLGDPLFVPYRQRIVDLAAQQHLPSICGEHQWGEAGCLMSYAASRADWGQQIATYVDKILHGAKPADLPVEQPMRYKLVINLKTAQALGLTIPPALLMLADEVIK